MASWQRSAIARCLQIVLVYCLLITHGKLTFEVSLEDRWLRTDYPAVKFAAGRILMIGGCDAEPCPNNQVWQSLDRGITWTKVNSGAQWSRRSSHQAVAVGRSVVMFGGQDTLSAYPTDVWSSNNYGISFALQLQAAPWPGRRLFQAVVTNQKDILMFGGLNSAGDMLNDVWQSSDLGASWSLVGTAQWPARINFCSVVMNDDKTVYIMGGFNVDNNFANDVWSSYNNGASWTVATTAADWVPRSYLGCGALTDDSIVVMGGQAPGSLLNDIWIGTDRGSTWSLMSSSSAWSPRSIYNLLVLEVNRPLIIGGSGANNKQLNDNWLASSVIETTTTTTTTLTTNTTSTTTTTNTTMTTTPTTTFSVTTSSVVIAPLAAGQLMKYFRFTVLETRFPSADAVHLSDIILRSAGVAVSFKGATASNPGGNSRLGVPANAIDGRTDTSWLDVNKAPFVIEFQNPVHADQFTFFTARNRPDADPCAWQVDVSTDSFSWTPLHQQLSCMTPVARSVQAPWFHLRQIVDNGGFELGSATLTYQISKIVPNWVVSGTVVFVPSRSPAWCNIAAAEGSYFLGIQGGQSEVLQSVPHHTPGFAYKLHFQAASCTDSASATLKVLIAGTEMLSFMPSNSSFSAHSAYYVANTSVVHIQFKNGGNSLEQSVVYIDHVLVVQAERTTTTTTTTTIPPVVEKTDIWWVLAGAAAGLAAVMVVMCIACLGFKALREGDCCFCLHRKSKSSVAVFDDIF